ncbi:putative membrane-bound acyltransferase YkrP [Lentibacillus sp. JNUCC-1]|uniref:acyltransferase family protein n=1 Tax=Lentibacillus sp. JNUCC-1 TaxID=2654513 RepID=UPI0013229093|nr:putative membrane-bound acyltransferase YkrP [Lentibacillus sp. JNUCC-1]
MIDVRDAYFDNARVLLIFLVVFGHVMQPYTGDSAALNTLYMWLYTFHMPAFILIAGFFAKGSGNMSYIKNLIKKLLVPYVIFQVVYTGYYFLLGKSGWESGLFHPQWSLWFLFSLFSWHILLILFKKWPPILGMLIAVQVGLIVGYFGDIGQAFSLSRTFVFFPFFLMGYWVTKEHLMKLKQTPVKVASIVIMVLVAVGIALAPDFNSGWLLASKSYDILGEPTFGGVGRLLIYITSALMTASVLAWVPRRSFSFTKVGVYTLYVYLLHGFLIQFLRVKDIEVSIFDSALDVLVFTGVAALIVYVLSTKPIRLITEPLIEGRVSGWKKLKAAQTTNIKKAS